MKKEKNHIPLPEGCEAFRGSWILGLTVTFGEIALVFLGIFIPVSICAALKERDPSFCAFILLVAVLLLMAYGTLRRPRPSLLPHPRQAPCGDPGRSDLSD